jgi:arylsulfatase A-like enzyme
VTPKAQIEPLDGVSLMPLVNGDMTSRGKPIPFVAQINTPASHAALIDWPWKLHTDPSNGGPRGKKKAAGPPVEPLMLFNIESDPKETMNLAGTQPERAAQMKETLEAWKESVRQSLTGSDYPGGLKDQASAEPAK